MERALKRIRAKLGETQSTEIVSTWHNLATQQSGAEHDEADGININLIKLNYS